jgi:hypothetical protein
MYVSCNVHLEELRETMKNHGHESDRYLRFEVLMAVSVKIMVVLDVMPYNLVGSADVSKESGATVFRLGEDGGNKVPPKYFYLSTTIHSVTSQETASVYVLTICQTHYYTAVMFSRHIQFSESL